MQLIRALVRQNSIDHVVALFLDPLQLALAAQFRPGGSATLSGILFRPSIHDIYRERLTQTPMEKVRDFRKHHLYRLMLTNPAVSSVLTLDPYFPSHARTFFRGGQKVRYLPDPAVGVPRNDDRKLIGEDLLDAVTTNRTVVSLFGALTERKGVLQVMDALAMLPVDSRATIRLVMAGKVDEELLPRLMDRQMLLRSHDATDSCFRLCNRSLSTAELGWLVRQSALILAPYQRFVGSSGVLSWAAAAQRPVIAQEYGLIGALVREFSLGVTTNTDIPSQIAGQLKEVLRPERLTQITTKGRWSDFLVDRTPENFASLVIDSSNADNEDSRGPGSIPMTRGH
jgi:glycosyltransferase involved in cell wall biosynthesis